MRTDVALTSGDGLILSVRVPSNVLLSEGPWLTVSGVYMAELEYVHCASGCTATVVLPSDLAQGLLSASDGMITVISIDQSRRGIPVSLVGLNDALTVPEGAATSE